MKIQATISRSLFFIDILTTKGKIIFYVWFGPDPFDKVPSIEFGMFNKMFIQWKKGRKKSGTA